MRTGSRLSRWFARARVNSVTTAEVLGVVSSSGVPAIVQQHADLSRPGDAAVVSREARPSSTTEQTYQLGDWDALQKEKLRQVQSEREARSDQVQEPVRGRPAPPRERAPDREARGRQATRGGR